MFQSNRPAVFSTSGVKASFTLIAVPSGPGAGLVVSDPALVFNDAASSADADEGNQVLVLPFSAMRPGMIVSLGTLSTGLTLSAIPSGVAVDVSFN